MLPLVFCGLYAGRPSLERVQPILPTDGPLASAGVCRYGPAMGFSQYLARPLTRPIAPRYNCQGFTIYVDP